MVHLHLVSNLRLIILVIIDPLLFSSYSPTAETFSISRIPSTSTIHASLPATPSPHRLRLPYRRLSTNRSSRRCKSLNSLPSLSCPPNLCHQHPQLTFRDQDLTCGQSSIALTNYCISNGVPQGCALPHAGAPRTRISRAVQLL